MSKLLTIMAILEIRDARVKRSHGVKSTISLVYRTSFFDPTYLYRKLSQYS